MPFDDYAHMYLLLSRAGRVRGTTVTVNVGFDTINQPEYRDRRTPIVPTFLVLVFCSFFPFLALSFDLPLPFFCSVCSMALTFEQHLKR